MVNILIADRNVNRAIDLMNYLNSKKKNARICGIVTDIIEAEKMLSSVKNIDVILLNFNIGIEILEKIKDKDMYIKSCIIMSTEKDYISELKTKYRLTIYSIIPKGIEIGEMFYKINELIEYKEKKKRDKEIRNKITEEILYLGYDFSRKGTIYLIESINYIALHLDTYLGNLEKDVYPIVAKMYNESVNNIKTNIIRANNAMYCECEIEKLKRYFYLDIDTKPKVKIVINTVINKISKYNNL